MKKLFTLFLLLPMFSFAQNQGNVWYFGGDFNNQSQYGAGIDFNTGTPSALTNSGMRYTEGCAAYCNSAGELIFYAQGDTVYDRTHNVMANGDGLGGHWSTQQSVIIVPVAGDTNKYYLFTNDGLATSNGTGLHYSVVDMQQNGGLGAVTEPKAESLLGNTAEYLTGCKHANGTDFWVITTIYDSSIFYAYKVSANGVSNPVVTNLGIPISFGSFCITNIEMSPNADRVAMKIKDGVNYVRNLIDFDNATGVFANPYPVGTPNGYNIACGFSPNGNVFYDFERIGATDSLFQYDLTAANIAASRTYIYSRLTQFQFDSKIGPDGKLYFSGAFNSPALDAINFPNVLGPACNFQANAVSLGGRSSGNMLPNELLVAPIFATSVDDYAALKNIAIYPNPAHTQFVVKTAQTSFAADDKLQLLSMTGQVLRTTAIVSEESTVEVAHLPQGTYILRVNLNGLQSSFKIVKQ